MGRTVTQAALEMDRGIADVMPKSWPGHARIDVLETILSDERLNTADELSDAEKLAMRLIEGGKTQSGKAAGLAACGYIEKHRGEN